MVMAEDALAIDASLCSTEDDRQILSMWYRYVRKTRNQRLIILFVLLLPGMFGVLRHALPILPIALIPFAIGIILPSLYSWATNLIRDTAYWSKGLIFSELDRTGQFFFRTELEMSHTMRSGTIHRVWSPKPTRVFISHAWKDAQRYQVAAEELATIFKSLDIPCFFDRWNIVGEFDPWRLQIVPYLLNCTHFFVVVDPDILEGDVVLREIKTAIQRWGTEVYPAIICIAEEEVARTLLANENLPRDLHFILTECPRLSLAEVTHPELVKYVVKQRRFQGMFDDWTILFAPNLALRYRQLSGSGKA
jgi:hypothetical protein